MASLIIGSIAFGVDKIKSKRAEKRARQADIDSQVRATQLESAREDERERRVAAKGREAGFRDDAANLENRRLSAEEDSGELDLPPPYMHTVPSYEETMRGINSPSAQANRNNNGQRGPGVETNERSERERDRDANRQAGMSDRARSSSSSSGDWGGPGPMRMLRPGVMSKPQGRRLQNARDEEGVVGEARTQRQIERTQRTDELHRGANVWTQMGAALTK